MSVLFIRAVTGELGVPKIAAATVALLGGIPMRIHDHLIVFRGSRLF
jgi:hypothetical protein